MPIILRTQKGKQLTIQEMDGNFETLDTRLRNIEQSNGGALDLTVVTLSPSGNGVLEYNSNTNLLAYTPPDLSEFITQETDPIFLASPAGSITSTDIANWDAAYNWGDHRQNYALIENVPQNISDLADISTAEPLTGQVLKWDGFQWIPSNDLTSDAGSGIALADLSVSTNIAGSPSLVYNNSTGVFTYTPPTLNNLSATGDTDFGPNKILYGNVYPLLSDLETVDPATYHGMFAHVHATGKGYFAHAGQWIPLANESDVPTTLLDLNITDGTSGQVLSTDGAGTFSFVDASSSTNLSTTSIDALSDVDTTTATPTTGQVLKWNGTQWIPASDLSSDGGTGISLTDLTVSVAAPATANLVYDNLTGVFTYTPPDLSSYLTNVSMNDISNVDTTGSVNGSILKYNGTTWVTSTDIGILRSDLSVDVSAVGTANLVYDNLTGIFTYTPPDLSAYLTSVTASDLNTIGIDALSDVDTTTATPTTGQVLKWNGSVWAPAADETSTGATGISLTDLSVSVAVPGTANLAYNNTTGVFTYTPPDLSSYLTSVAFADLTSTPTTLSGYGITDALSNTALGDFSFESTTIDTVASAAITVVPDITFNGAVEFTTLQSTGAGVLTLDSASSITITASDNVNITTGTGNIVLDNQNWPQADGTAGQYLQTNGLGQLSWATVPSSTDQNLFATIVSDSGSTTANTTTDTLTISGGTDITTSIANDILTVNFSGSTGIVSVQADVTPQLGGDLDIDVYTILSTFDLGSTSSSTDYTFTDPGNNYFPTAELDPVLYLRRGETYQFINVPGIHPLAIRVSAGGSNYNTGVVNNGGSGTVTFTVPMSAPATLYYQCTVHSGMGNTINIV